MLSVPFLVFIYKAIVNVMTYFSMQKRVMIFLTTK